MRKRVWSGLLVGFFLSLSSTALAAATMMPGLWEITASIEMPGIPFQPPPQTMQHCYTDEDVKSEPVPANENCQITNLKTSGNKITWQLECKGEMAGKGQGEIVFQGDSAYEGNATIEAQGMIMVTKYKGRRIGECK
jgi:hypothetical protein